jgi:hypothetical protein
MIEMQVRLTMAALAALAALALSACSAVNCGGHGDSRDAGGGCRAHTTF